MTDYRGAGGGFQAKGGDPRQRHPGARVCRCRCSLPGLTGLTACRRGGTDAGHPRKRWNGVNHLAIGPLCAQTIHKKWRLSQLESCFDRTVSTAFRRLQPCCGSLARQNTSDRAARQGLVKYSNCRHRASRCMSASGSRCSYLEHIARRAKFSAARNELCDARQ